MLRTEFVPQEAIGFTSSYTDLLVVKTKYLGKGCCLYVVNGKLLAASLAGFSCVMQIRPLISESAFRGNSRSSIIGSSLGSWPGLRTWLRMIFAKSFPSRPTSER